MKSLDSPALSNLKEVVRRIRATYFPFQDAAIRIFGHVARRRSLIRELRPASDPQSNSKLAAVYVHFDGDGLVADYVIHQLRELVDAGFRITFISNSPTFPEQNWARVSPFCRNAMWRFNTGYDFGAYKDGIALIADLNDLDGLVLMNDSVYGPFWKLRDTLSIIDTSGTDFWGIADSWEYQHHIQTFFMIFFPKALRTSAFKTFWASLPYVNHKRWVIRNGEVKLSQVLESAGLRSGVLAPYWSVAKTMKTRILEMDKRDLPPSERSGFDRFRSRVLGDRAINPMQYFWDILITDYRCPFIKRQLIQSNPAHIPFTSRWPDVIQSRSDYDVTMIKRHLLGNIPNARIVPLSIKP
jgi:lipopolysaccharide biosynthesis protein